MENKTKPCGEYRGLSKVEAPFGIKPYVARSHAIITLADLRKHCEVKITCNCSPLGIHLCLNNLHHKFLTFFF